MTTTTAPALVRIEPAHMTLQQLAAADLPGGEFGYEELNLAVPGLVIRSDQRTFPKISIAKWERDAEPGTYLVTVDFMSPDRTFLVTKFSARKSDKPQWRNASHEAGPRKIHGAVKVKAAHRVSRVQDPIDFLPLYRERRDRNLATFQQETRSLAGSLRPLDDLGWNAEGLMKLAAVVSVCDLVLRTAEKAGPDVTAIKRHEIILKEVERNLRRLATNLVNSMDQGSVMARTVQLARMADLREDLVSELRTLREDADARIWTIENGKAL